MEKPASCLHNHVLHVMKNVDRLSVQLNFHTKRFKLSWDQDLYKLNTGVVDSLHPIHSSSLTKRE